MGNMQPYSTLLFLLLLPLTLPAPRQPGQTVLDIVSDALATSYAINFPVAHHSLFPWAGSRPLRDAPEPPSLDPTWVRFFSDFMNGQRKFRGRTKKVPPPQGCFGMKLDRIGTFSRLGC